VEKRYTNLDVRDLQGADEERSNIMKAFQITAFGLLFICSIPSLGANNLQERAQVLLQEYEELLCGKSTSPQTMDKLKVNNKKIECQDNIARMSGMEGQSVEEMVKRMRQLTASEEGNSALLDDLKSKRELLQPEYDELSRRKYRLNGYIYDLEKEIRREKKKSNTNFSVVYGNQDKIKEDKKSISELESRMELYESYKSSQYQIESFLRKRHYPEHQYGARIYDGANFFGIDFSMVSVSTRDDASSFVGSSLVCTKFNPKDYGRDSWHTYRSLYGVDLSGADFRLADLKGTDLRGANFDPKNPTLFAGSIYNFRTQFPRFWSLKGDGKSYFDSQRARMEQLFRAAEEGMIPASGDDLRLLNAEIRSFIENQEEKYNGMWGWTTFQKKQKAKQMTFINALNERHRQFIRKNHRMMANPLEFLLEKYSDIGPLYSKCQEILKYRDPLKSRIERIEEIKSDLYDIDRERKEIIENEHYATCTINGCGRCDDQHTGGSLRAVAGIFELIEVLGSRRRAIPYVRSGR